MNLSLDVSWLSAFLLAMTRSTAWVFTCPPFNSGSIPQKVKLGLAMALAMFVAPSFHASPVMLDTWGFLGAAVYQAFVGLALGFGVLVLMSAMQAAGALIDLQVGFGAASLYDPFSNAASSPIGRLFQVISTTILFVSGGHLLIVKGFLLSFSSDPTKTVAIDQVYRVVLHNAGTFFAAAIQIAVPLLASLFLAEITLGLIARAAPQLNVLTFGFAVKILALLALVGLAIRILPASLYQLTQQAAQTLVALGSS